MTQEDRDLLIKDLSTRLPYGVKVLYDTQIFEVQYIEPMYGELKLLDNETYTLPIEEVKPYLFPLSSMTKEQKEEFNSYFTSVPYYGDNEHEHVVPYYFVELLMEFFHKNHIDNNGLIQKGLANDATNLNIY